MLKYSITQKNKARGDNAWYGRTFDTITKEVKYVSLGTSLKRIADEWLRQKIADEVAGVRHNDSLTIESALNDYLKNFKGFAGGYVTIFRILKVFCAERSVTKFKDVDSLFCVDLFNHMADKKASTRRQRLTLYKTWWKWCATAYGIKGAENPFKLIRIEKPEPAERSFWTTEQLVQILDAAENREDRLTMALMCYAGLRIHEVIKMRGEDIHDGKIYVVGKGKKFATIPISNRMQSELDRFGKLPQGRLFRRTCASSFYMPLKNLIKSHPWLDFGGKVHPHRFRHSFASNLVRNGCSLTIVMRLMRHSNISMTMIYAHLLPDDLTDAINKF